LEEDPLFDPAAFTTTTVASQHDLIFRYHPVVSGPAHYWQIFILVTFGVFCTFVVLYFFGAIILGVIKRLKKC